MINPALKGKKKIFWTEKDPRTAEAIATELKRLGARVAIPTGHFTPSAFILHTDGVAIGLGYPRKEYDEYLNVGFEVMTLRGLELLEESDQHSAPARCCPFCGEMLCLNEDDIFWSHDDPISDCFLAGVELSNEEHFIHWDRRVLDPDLKQAALLLSEIADDLSSEELLQRLEILRNYKGESERIGQTIRLIEILLRLRTRYPELGG